LLQVRGLERQGSLFLTAIDALVALPIESNRMPTPERKSALGARNAQAAPERRSNGNAWHRARGTGLGLVVCAGLLGLAGCPANLEDPERFAPAAAAAGSNGSAGGGAVVPGLNVDTTCLQEAFSASCATAGCHKSGANAAAGLDLGSPGVNRRLIDVVAPHTGAFPNTGCVSNQKLIDSSNAAASWLLIKITAADPNSCGVTMPIGAPLSADHLACIKKYADDVAAAATSGGM